MINQDQFLVFKAKIISIKAYQLVSDLICMLISIFWFFEHIYYAHED